MRYYQLFIIICVLGLSGCVIPHNKPKLSSAELTNAGVVYFSTASIQECLVHNVYLVLKQETDEKSPNFTPLQYFVTNPYIEKDFPETRGLFQISSLPEGKYNFGFEQRHQMLIVDYEQMFTPFEIKKGEVKYLGEIRVDGCLDIAVNIGDEFERDTSKLQVEYPDIGHIQSSKELINLKAQGSSNNTP